MHLPEPFADLCIMTTLWPSKEGCGPTMKWKMDDKRLWIFLSFKRIPKELGGAFATKPAEIWCGFDVYAKEKSMFA